MRSLIRPCVLAATITSVLITGCGGSDNSTSAETNTGAKSAQLASCLNSSDGFDAQQFTAGDSQLEGATIGAGKVGVVFANDSRNDLCAWQQIALELSDRGVTSALFNYQDVGSPSETQAVIGALHDSGAEKVVVIGASVGGRTVVQLAADPEAGIEAAISLSGERKLHNGPPDLLPFAARSQVPTLYASGKGDPLTNFAADTRQLYAAAKQTPGTRLLVVDGNNHGAALLSIPQVRSAVLRAIGS